MLSAITNRYQAILKFVTSRYWEILATFTNHHWGFIEHEEGHRAPSRTVIERRQGPLQTVIERRRAPLQNHSREMLSTWAPFTNRCRGNINNHFKLLLRYIDDRYKLLLGGIKDHHKLTAIERSWARCWASSQTVLLLSDVKNCYELSLRCIEHHYDLSSIEKPSLSDVENSHELFSSDVKSHDKTVIERAYKVLKMIASRYKAMLSTVINRCWAQSQTVMEHNHKTLVSSCHRRVRQDTSTCSAWSCVLLWVLVPGRSDSKDRCPCWYDQRVVEAWRASTELSQSRLRRTQSGGSCLYRDNNDVTLRQNTIQTRLHPKTWQYDTPSRASTSRLHEQT